MAGIVKLDLMTACEWILAHGPLINTIGLLLDIVGACLVAWEVVRRYEGTRYEQESGVALRGGRVALPEEVIETRQ